MVVRYLDGRILKGFSYDFYPTQERFVLTERETGQEIEVPFADLKAIFFVKDFDTDGAVRPREDIERFGLGRKIKVHFRDGEDLVGFSSTYAPDRRTFIVFPGDPDCNSQKVVVTAKAVDSVEVL
jgi:Family of unknown function (DUF6982)